MKRHCESLCAKFQLAMDVLAKPWNGLIMAMLAEGPARFSELGEKLSAIGDRMLAERLRELEARALVVRHVEEGPPVRVRYELTKAGHGFSQVADAIGEWGEQLTDTGAVASRHAPAGRRPTTAAAARTPRATSRKAARTKDTQARTR